MELCYGGTDIQQLGYVYYDFVGDINSRRSTTDYVFNFGKWSCELVSRLQMIVSLSTTKENFF